jgi:hypothetical protein
VLVDVFSVSYVQTWRMLLEWHRVLHVFGMTARCDKSHPIATALLALVHDYPDRFSMSSNIGSKKGISASSMFSLFPPSSVSAA